MRGIGRITRKNAVGRKKGQRWNLWISLHLQYAEHRTFALGKPRFGIGKKVEGGDLGGQPKTEKDAVGTKKGQQYQIFRKLKLLVAREKESSRIREAVGQICVSYKDAAQRLVDPSEFTLTNFDIVRAVYTHYVNNGWNPLNFLCVGLFFSIVNEWIIMSPNSLLPD